MSANTNPYSASGHPALSLPVGFSPPSDADVWTEEDRHIRLPVGLQIVAAKFNEMDIFIAADAWERAYGQGRKDTFGLDRVGKPRESKRSTTRTSKTLTQTNSKGHYVARINLYIEHS
jgi:hypothetical protein